MSDLHRISESSFRRAAHGHHGKSVDVGHQHHPGPVTVTADLHVEITRDTEADGRQFLLAMESALLGQGGSVTVTNGPEVRPAGPRKPRLQQ